MRTGEVSFRTNSKTTSRTVLRRSFSHSVQFLFGHFRSLNPGSDLVVGDLSRGGEIVVEGRKSAVVGGAQLFDGNVLRCFDHSFADFFRRLHAVLQRIDDADEDPVPRLHQIPNARQHAMPVGLRRQLQEEVAHVQFEQRRKNQQIVHFDRMVTIFVSTCREERCSQPGEKSDTDLDRRARRSDAED